LFKKIIILGIISLAAIAVALMPSPGNFLYRQAENKLMGNSEPIATTVQMPTQVVPIIDVITGLANQTSTPPVTSPAPRSTIKTVPIPIYANVTVTPENTTVTVNQTFKVDIWINNVTDMAGWQIGLLWDKETIKCVEAQVNTPPEWGGVGFDWFNKTAADVNVRDVYTAWQFGEGIENDYNDTCGRYFKAETFGPRGSGFMNTFNGSIPALTLTFQALQTGSSSLSFTDVEIGNGKAAPIGYAVYNGIVEVQAR
jgi:hypothetical protein